MALSLNSSGPAPPLAAGDLRAVFTNASSSLPAGLLSSDVPVTMAVRKCRWILTDVCDAAAFFLLQS